MKKNILALFFLLILPSLAFGQPSILFDELIHDFGTVGQEDVVKYVFEFTNRGDQELIVEKVSAT